MTFTPTVTSWRIVPDDGKSISLHPPGHNIAAIRNEYYCLEYGHNPFSHKASLRGVFDGFIGPDLRMHVLVNAGDEVLMSWEPSEGRSWEPSGGRS